METKAAVADDNAISNPDAAAVPIAVSEIVNDNGQVWVGSGRMTWKAK